MNYMRTMDRNGQWGTMGNNSITIAIMLLLFLFKGPNVF